MGINTGFWIKLPLGCCMLLLSGCASDYWGHRYRDALDIVTATTGSGYGGAKIRCGPIGTGVFHEFPEYGLRGGDFISPDKMVKGDKLPNGDYQLLVLGGEDFYGTTQNIARAKSFEAVMRAGINIPLALVRPNVPRETIAEVQQCSVANIRTSPIAYLTQIELALGFVKTIRLGLNFGEALDFVLGFITIDILQDDQSCLPIKREIDTIGLP